MVPLAPPRGEYGPVPWSVSRPPTLWAYTMLSLAGGVTEFARMMDADWISTSLSLAIWTGWLYLLLRGSRLMWWLALVFEGLAAIRIFTVSSSESAGYVLSAMLAVRIILLLVTPTRNFFDLEWRRTHFPSDAPAPQSSD